jgi:putative membrane protein
VFRLILALGAALLPAVASAHSGAHPVKSGPPAWTFEPWVVSPVVITLTLYLIGFLRLKRRARASYWRNATFFLAGWFVLAVALVSPLHEAGERSFTLHMIEHEVIMLVAALLIALAHPLGIMLWAFPRAARRRLRVLGMMTRLSNPVLATVLQAVTMIVWHVPALFDRALGHPAWHVAQHLSFVVTALLFWWSVIRTPNRGLAALCLFATSIVGGALGAMMSLSASPWYANYAAMVMMPFGLTPKEDQQLAGLIMWVPGGLFHAGAALILLGRYLTGNPSQMSRV